jgi:hypothetical protein
VNQIPRNRLRVCSETGGLLIAPEIPCCRRFDVRLQIFDDRIGFRPDIQVCEDPMKAVTLQPPVITPTSADACLHVDAGAERVADSGLEPLISVHVQGHFSA